MCVAGGGGEGGGEREAAEGEQQQQQQRDSKAGCLPQNRNSCNIREIVTHHPWGCMS